ncbi:hypothetical protein RCL1_007508 [Eukaryota sp. TZLM3-RCL]
MQSHPLSNSYFLHTKFFKRVANATLVIEKLQSSSLSWIAVNSDLLLNIFQVLCACEHIVVNKGSRISKNMAPGTEFFYTISPTKHVSDALNIFGLNDSNNNCNILFLKISQLESEDDSELSFLDGEVCDVSELPISSNLNRIKEIYSINSSSDDIDKLVGEVTTKMLSKMF